MVLRIFVGSVILALGAPGFAETQPAPSAERPMQKLGWLVGQWHTRDEQLAGDYRETGPRDCAWGLDGRYIVCHGVGTNHLGRSREYVWYFNYNAMDERFEMNSLYGDWPRKNLFVIDASEDGHRLDVTSYYFTAEGLTPGNRQTVIYDGSDRYVWTIFNGEPDPDTGEPTAGFVDTATRVTASVR